MYRLPLLVCIWLSDSCCFTERILLCIKGWPHDCGLPASASMCWGCRCVEPSVPHKVPWVTWRPHGWKYSSEPIVLDFDWSSDIWLIAFGQATLLLKTLFSFMKWDDSCEDSLKNILNPHAILVSIPRVHVWAPSSLPTPISSHAVDWKLPECCDKEGWTSGLMNEAVMASKSNPDSRLSSHLFPSHWLPWIMLCFHGNGFELGA